MGAFFFLIVVIAVIGIAFSARHRRVVRDNWQAAANRMGLQVRLGSRPEMWGSVLENQVHVHTVRRGSGNSRRTYTCYEITYPRPLGLSLQITKQGFWGGLQKALGAQDIEVRDPEFDQLAMIKGADTGRVIEFLTPARRYRIRRALAGFPSLRLEDHRVYCERTGAESGQDRLMRTVEQLAQLAWHLTGDRDEEAPLARALEAKAAGRLDDAMQQVNAMTAGGNADRAQIGRRLGGEILAVAGRNAEAARKFEEAVEADPDDEEARQWQRDAVAPPPVPGTTPAPESPGIRDVLTDARAVCDDLFSGGKISGESSRVFEASFVGRTVRWTGILRRAEPFRFDFVFGSEPGCRATVVVHEIQREYGSKQPVQAIVQLPEAACGRLKDRAGEEFAFEGTLHRIDGLMKNVYVKDGTVTSKPVGHS